MNIISNKEIYILLKILTNKRLLRGSTPVFQVDNIFTKQELEHLQQEISSVNNKSPNKILKIKETLTKRIAVPSLYNITIIDAQAIINYANQYIDAWVNNTINGISSNNEFKSLIKEFYFSLSNENNFKNYIEKDLKHMPVILWAYINKIIEINSLNIDASNYNTLQDDIFLDSPVFLKLAHNGMSSETKLSIGIDASQLSELMVTIGIGTQQEEISADLLFEAITKIKSQRQSSSETHDKNYYIEKLKDDFKLNNTEINILRACVYLLTKEYKVINEQIAQYLTHNDYPINENSIKQYTANIKNKCCLNELTGLPALVNALQLKGYIIPPYKPKSSK